MTKSIAALLACLALAFLPSNSHADGPDDSILGVWKTAENKGEVRIFKRDNKYFGQILSLAQPNWPAHDKPEFAGKPKTDRSNPDPKLRDRRVLGIEFMRDFVFVRKDLWEDGKVYDPESGKTYKCKMILKKPGELEVRGFIGFSLFGRTTVWTR